MRWHSSFSRSIVSLLIAMAPSVNSRALPPRLCARTPRPTSAGPRRRSTAARESRWPRRAASARHSRGPRHRGNARRPLAVECEHGGPVAPDLPGERCRVVGLRREAGIRACFRLAEVGEADAVAQHRAELGGRQQAGREAHALQRRPEAVAGAGVVGARPRRGRACRRAADDDAEPWAQHVGQDMPACHDPALSPPCDRGRAL